MKLTALEIKQQTFDKSLRGFDPGEVQAFLNLVSNEWEHLVTRNKELTAQIEQLNDKLKHYERVESALHETLQTARESAEQKLGGAKQESRNILEKAELEAEAIIREAYQERQQIRQNVVRLLDKRNEIISGIRSFLDRSRESLEHFSRDEADLFTLHSAEKESNKSSSLKKEKGDSAEKKGKSPEKGERQTDASKQPAKAADKPGPASAADPAEKTRASGASAKKTAAGKPENKKKGETPSGAGDEEMDNILDQIE